MDNNIFGPDINKDYILQRLTQESIFEKYLGIPVEFGGLICSPLRTDRNPTCQFKWFGNKLIFRDFSGHFNGDCFDLVGFLYNINFRQAMDKVAADFMLTNQPIKYQRYELEIVEKQDTDIKVQWGVYSQQDLDYWYSQGASKTELKKYNVAPVKIVWLNNKIVYKYKDSDPGYGYWFRNNEIKIYFPQRKTYRFLCNTNIIQGYDQLPEKGDILIVTKSLKDIMVLDRLGYNAISLQAESQILSAEQYEELSNRFNEIYSFYDFDLAGVRSANKMKKLYNIQPIFLTNGRFYTVNRHAKDISELYYLGGDDLIHKTIKELSYEEEMRRLER